MRGILGIVLGAKRPHRAAAFAEQEFPGLRHIVAKIKQDDPIPEFIIECRLGYKVAPDFAADPRSLRKRHEAFTDNAVERHEKRDDLLPRRAGLLEHPA